MILRVHENVVVLGRPAARGLRAVVVCPNQLVNEVLTPKNHVAHDFHVVHFAPIQVQIQGAVLREQTVRLLNARGQERPVVLEGVIVTRQGLQGAGVVLALEPGAVALLGGLRAQRAARLLLACVEGRVNVDDRERAVRQLAQVVQVIGLHNQGRALRVERGGATRLGGGGHGGCR